MNMCHQETLPLPSLTTYSSLISSRVCGMDEKGLGSDIFHVTHFALFPYPNQNSKASHPYFLPDFKGKQTVSSLRSFIKDQELGKLTACEDIALLV